MSNELDLDSKQLQAKILAKERLKSKYLSMLQKMEREQGYDIGENFRLKMKLNRVVNEDPNTLILKRRIQDMSEEIEDLELQMKKIEQIGKEKLLDREKKIVQLTNKCKKAIVDIHNNMDIDEDEDRLKKQKNIRELDHQGGLFLDVMNDEHEIIVENLEKTKEANLVMRVKLDKQKLQISNLRRNIVKAQEAQAKHEADIAAMKKKLGKDDDDYSEEEDIYDDPAVIARKRDRKLKGQIA